MKTRQCTIKDAEIPQTSRERQIQYDARKAIRQLAWERDAALRMANQILSDRMSEAETKSSMSIT